jgi:hypothetical protein
MQHSDAIVTFWPRQQALWKSFCDKNTIVDCVPMGVEKDFWKATPSAGKYRGTPSLFTAENAHYVKWPLDLFLIWGWVNEELVDACLHSAYLPTDQHRWWFPLVNRNASHYGSVISSQVLAKEPLRNAFCSTDYFIGLVRYGDFNRLCLEANACGATSISYRGNPYSDYWITEGDQRDMTKELLSILKGEVEPRQKEVVPDILDTAKAMQAIYERIL